MALVSLLIIYQWALRNVAFWLQHLPWVAGWLWAKLQAEPKSTKETAVALSDLPSPYLKADFQHTNEL